MYSRTLRYNCRKHGLARKINFKIFVLTHFKTKRQKRELKSKKQLPPNSLIDRRCLLRIIRPSCQPKVFQFTNRAVDKKSCPTSFEEIFVCVTLAPITCTPAQRDNDIPQHNLSSSCLSLNPLHLHLYYIYYIYIPITASYGELFLFQPTTA